MFVTLFLEDDAEDLLAEAELRRRAARRSRRAARRQPRPAVRITVRGRDDHPGR